MKLKKYQLRFYLLLSLITLSTLFTFLIATTHWFFYILLVLNGSITTALFLLLINYKKQSLLSKAKSFKIKKPNISKKNLKEQKQSYKPKKKKLNREEIEKRKKMKAIQYEMED